MAAQAKSAPLRVVVLGDSLIWGQGLREVEKFSTTALKEIARLAGRQLDVERNLSRSGAQILEGQDETQRRAKRQEYVDTYPSRYNSQKLRDDFVLRNDQLVTFFLPSEVPNTFPTITFQVGVVSEAIGKGIDIVLLDGGVNDIDFETYLNPFEAEGNFIAAFDGMFQEVFDRRVRELLLSARRRFPNALLIYTGYFLPFSFNVRNGAVLLHADAAQAGIGERSDRAAAGRKREGVAEQRPHHGDGAERDEAHHHRVEHVLRAHETAVKERERGRHQEHQRRGHQHPGDVGVIHDDIE